LQPSLADPQLFASGVKHVSRADPRIQRLVQEHGTIKFKPQGRVFESLVESILSQQLNGKSAAAIIGRVNELFKPKGVKADSLLRVNPSKLRKAGVSPQKLSYLKDLSGRVVDGRLQVGSLWRKSDSEILDALDEVRGVGPWTAQMVMMFTLGRPDVLPVDDFGIKKAVQTVYGLAELPRKEVIERIAEPWHPYCTVACLYLWKQKDA
jgi:DNA-3-methyladenine glycosylase II